MLIDAHGARFKIGGGSSGRRVRLSRVLPSEERLRLLFPFRSTARRDRVPGAPHLTMTTNINTEHEILTASAATFLLQGGTDVELQAAQALSYCAVADKRYDGSNSWPPYGLTLEVCAPRAVYDLLGTSQAGSENPVRDAIVAAFDAVLPADEYCSDLCMRAELVSVDVERWRDEIRKLSVSGATNQGIDFGKAPLKTWMNLRFRSSSEVRTAQALDRMGVLFLPNCMARVGALGERQNREADFLVILNGKVGILEVDGDLSHPPTRAVQDHARDRLFKRHGVKLIEHFDWRECYNDADRVVGRFLDLLKAS